MKYGKTRQFLVLVVVILLSVTLISCKNGSDSKASKASSAEPAKKFQKIPLPLAKFKRVMGWLTKEEVLVHSGEGTEDVLYRFNVFSGKLSQLYDPEGLILTTAISPDRKKIFLQLADMEKKASRLQVIDTAGRLLNEESLATPNYLNINWNASNNNALFLAYYESENNLKVLNWQLSSATIQEIPNDSLTPIWYSDHLYLYVDNLGEFFLTHGKLYLGDTRTGEKSEINSQISNFWLSNDALITFTPSDFNEEALLVNYQYPFMVDAGFLEIPKMTMNNRLLFPYLTQKTRQAPIYGVFPKKAVRLELEAGKFQLGKLDFKKSKIDPILDLPDNAPIQISPDGEHFLYGWRFEYAIDTAKHKINPFFNFPKQK